MAIKLQEGVPFKDQWATIYFSINGRDRFIKKDEIRGMLGQGLRDAGFNTAAQRMKAVNKKLSFKRKLIPATLGVSQERLTSEGTCKNVRAVGKYWTFVTWNVRTLDHGKASAAIEKLGDVFKLAPAFNELRDVESKLFSASIFEKSENVKDRVYAKWWPNYLGFRPFTRPLPDFDGPWTCGFTRKDVKVPPLPPPVPPKPGIGAGITGLAMVVAATLMGKT
jgi:hypothetical protein